ncbi:patatin-like phospholipase family protein [Undibacterium hunanense]|uniref:patatin-like phospholipase family protein n=1 Tax=Undibacterium hunanense TaxID=2762292 RepID=UPI001C9B6311|nr:patatin-like phospholipase family protein [Undibacterium hunanense]
MKRYAVLSLAMLLSACSTFHPWQNEIAKPVSGTLARESKPAKPQSIVVAVTMSGGGARAAAFGLGVLRELKDTRFTWEGESTTILDKLGMISGVSGGSILATYYAAFGDDTFNRFESEFLLSNFEGSLIQTTFSPKQMYRLRSPWYGRSQVLSEQLNRLYRGLTFGDLQKNPRAPELVVTATDLTTGAPFEFTADQFALICSDLDSVPLSFAAAASSAVPIVLTPLTLRNYAQDCPNRSDAARVSKGNLGEDNYRSRIIKATEDSYKNAAERPFLHLVDGGLTDNLGVRMLLDRAIADGSVQANFRDAPPGSIRRVVLISINSERDLAERIDQNDKVPTTGQVADALLFGVGSRDSQVTLAMLNDDVTRWNREIIEHRGKKDSPFAADAEMHVISVSLRDIKDRRQRRTLLQVPTAFTIAPDYVEQLQLAGREVLRQSSEFQRMLESLKKVSPPPPQDLKLQSFKQQMVE